MILSFYIYLSTYITHAYVILSFYILSFHMAIYIHECDLIFLHCILQLCFTHIIRVHVVDTTAVLRYRRYCCCWTAHFIRTTVLGIQCSIWIYSDHSKGDGLSVVCNKNLKYMYRRTTVNVQVLHVRIFQYACMIPWWLASISMSSLPIIRNFFCLKQ